MNTQMDTMEKLRILTDAAKYDAVCTSSGVNRAGVKGQLGSAAACGICHSFASDGRCISLLKVLMTNVCAYDCTYCLNRRSNDTPRATFRPQELADLTISFYRRNYIEGLFLSSAVFGSPDITCERMLESDNTALLEQIRSDKSSAESELSRTEEEEYVLANMMAAKIAEMQQQMAQAKATPTPTPVPTVEPTPTPTPVPEEEVDDNGNVMPTPTPTPVPTVKPTPTPTPVPQPSYGDDYSGESFAWPVPGWTGVSCAFGNGHYGMDIPASRGTPIVASRSGTVMTANGSDDWGYSWGYYVSIYHDGTYSTLYAHMSAVAVSEGQWVNKGDVIGYVGDTGYSFGDHCHFEVYQNGTRVDPSQFV